MVSWRRHSPISQKSPWKPARHWHVALPITVTQTPAFWQGELRQGSRSVENKASIRMQTDRDQYKSWQSSGLRRKTLKEDAKRAVTTVQEHNYISSPLQSPSTAPRGQKAGPCFDIMKTTLLLKYHWGLSGFLASTSKLKSLVRDGRRWERENHYGPLLPSSCDDITFTSRASSEYQLTSIRFVWDTDNWIPVSQVVPEYNPAHWHVNWLTPSMHVPPLRQGEVWHSSISARM